jgi:hypothetical protein
MAPFADEIAGGEIRMASQAATVLGNKLHLQDKLITAYSTRDMQTLMEIAEREIPAIIEDYREFRKIYRRQWLRRNKKFGMEHIQSRLGGQIAEWEDVAKDIMDFVEGRTSEIAEHND